MVYQTRLETEYAVPTASLAPRVQRGTMPGPPGAGFLLIIVFGISGPPYIALSPIARSVSRASTVRRGSRIVNNCKYEMNDVVRQADGAVCLLSLQPRRALPKVPRWGRTISRTSSQNVVTRDARAVSCASNHHYDRVIGRCCTVTIEADTTAWTTAKLHVRREIPPHCRNHSRRLRECLLEQPVGATGQRSRVSRARQYGECKQV